MEADPNDMEGLAKAVNQEPATLTQQEAYEALPKLGRELVDVLGFDAAMRLIDELGGKRIEISRWPLRRRSPRFDRLVALIGQEAAEKFADRWAGIEIQVPTGARLRQLERVRAAVAAYDAGASVPQLAGHFHVTESTVWWWLKKPV